MESYADREYKKIMILFPDSQSRIYNEIKKRIVSTYAIYRNIPFFLYTIRKLHVSLKLPFESIWYGSWKKSEENIETIILFDSVYSSRIVKWIIKNKKDARLIFWFWNPVNVGLLNELRSLSCELWSFDKNDCKKYGLNYNAQFYFHTVHAVPAKRDHDIVFIGRDKNRLSKLIELKQLFDSNGLNTYFHIVSDKSFTLNNKTKPIPYDELLSITMRSNAILDLVQDGQSGLTLRTMEGIYLRRKIITNNQEIKYMDFYTPENIFILGVDDIASIKQFVSSPYLDLPNSIMAKYDFGNWLDAFNKERP